MRMKLTHFLKELFKIITGDYGWDDHLVGQILPPFYCGTAFCGHATKWAARKCWKNKCEAMDAIKAEAKALRKAGKPEDAWKIELKLRGFYPEDDPANWPCNRSRGVMEAEYIERARRERKGLYGK